MKFMLPITNEHAKTFFSTIPQQVTAASTNLLVVLVEDGVVGWFLIALLLWGRRRFW